MAAYLSERHDPDLLAWVEELVAQGRMAETIKEGLRLVRYFAGLEGGEQLLRRGILSEAVKAGIFPPTGGMRPAPSPSGLEKGAQPTSDLVKEGPGPDPLVAGGTLLDRSLDRALKGM